MFLNPFQSPRQRLARARAHFRSLQATIQSFTDTHPYRMVVDIDTDGVTKVHKYKMTASLPDDLTDITQDAIENLRSALDQAGYAAAILNGVSDPKHAYFPVAQTLSGLETVIKGRCKDIPVEIIALFRTFQPYRGGNDAIWAMNRMANAKHTVLAPVGNVIAGTRMKMVRISAGGSPVSLMVPKWDAAKQEMIFAKVGPGGTLDYDVDFAMYIAFGKTPVFEGQPVLSVLDHLSGLVDSIIAATENECRRIGILKV